MNIAERNEPVATNVLKIMKQKGLKAETSLCGKESRVQEAAIQ